MFAVALVCVAACTTPQAPSAPFALAGASWQRVDDADANPHGATLEFAAARASGYAGCNRWFAGVTSTETTMRFSAIGTTRMACQVEVQAATERNFLAALGKTRGYHLEAKNSYSLATTTPSSHGSFAAPSPARARHS